jgi:S-adenosylmethionine hydrolase
MSILSLLTDFGTADYYVAAVKGTVLRLAPGTVLVDVSHEVPPGDVETAAFLLAAAAPSFPEDTVHLAVVDPGVGSERRILAVRTPAAWFLAPDNGLLTPMLDGALSVRSVERSGLFLPSPGQTFHGRDRFAPAAAALLRGEPGESLGPEITDPQRLSISPPRRSTGRITCRITGRIVHIDRYGNLISDIPTAWLPPGPCRAEVEGHEVDRRVDHYAEIPAGEAALLPGSLGTVEISVNGEDLARRWGTRRGDKIDIFWNES